MLWTILRGAVPIAAGLQLLYRLRSDQRRPPATRRFTGWLLRFLQACAGLLVLLGVTIIGTGLLG